MSCSCCGAPQSVPAACMDPSYPCEPQGHEDFSIIHTVRHKALSKLESL